MPIPIRYLTITTRRNFPSTVPVRAIKLHPDSFNRHRKSGPTYPVDTRRDQVSNYRSPRLIVRLLLPLLPLFFPCRCRALLQTPLVVQLV